MAKLSPSILTADFTRLGETLALFARHPVVGWVHFDVMDGAFVPNISFGAPVVRSAAASGTKLPFDVHLMVADPGRYVADYVTPNTEYIVVHQEACTHLDRVLAQIRDLGVKCGVALNPATPLDTLDYVLDKVDQVLVMSVNPGFGGQSFIPSALDKIRALAESRRAHGLEFAIAVDGGVKESNIRDVASAGADIIIAGSAVLNNADPDAALSRFAALLGDGA
ncbi:MAG: ribulose-phosphate 3-epimerase [Clostridiales Family XIII bacterium]|jgi:ribulose-phosphate 3-epimerase|nr:ribulose-phosphate 3-epimerase [Clostridiales Family XIII bacterium]